MDRSTIAFGVTLVLALVMGVSEVFGIGRLAYSKFRGGKGGGMSTRLGMVIIYALPIGIYSGLWAWAGCPRSAYHLALLVAFDFHFAKRVAESLWLHHYSAPTPVATFVNVALAYGGGAALAGYFQNIAPAQPLDAVFIAGASLFVVGQVVNGWHHVLLARLRSDGGTGYKTPRGGLFALVACPHYLGEIVSFWGLALMARVLPTYGAAIIVTVYLGTRSHSTLKWYRQKLPSLPAGWRRLIPFVY